MSAPGELALLFLISAALCLVAGRLVIPALVRAQCVAPLRYEDCPPLLTYQQGKQRTPTMGGLFVLGVGILVAAAAGGLRHREGWLVMGAVIGIGIGIVLATLLNIRVDFLVFSLPIGSLIVFALAAIVVGIIAAILPARRAARLDPLQALQYE